MSYKDTIAEAKRKASGGSDDVSQSVALGIATATERPRRVIPSAERLDSLTAATPSSAHADSAIRRGTDVASDVSQQETHRGFFTAPSGRAKPDRQGVDFGRGRLEVIKDTIRFLERRGIKTGAKMGASIIVGAALDRFLPMWRSDPEAFAQLMREHIEGRDAAFAAAFADYLNDAPVGRI